MAIYKFEDLLKLHNTTPDKVTSYGSDESVQNSIKKLEEKQKTFGGKVLRETIRPLANVATNVVNAGQIALGKEETQPFSGEYLGEVKGLGKLDMTKGFTPENIKVLKDSVKAGVDIGLLLSGGGNAVKTAQTGLKEGIIQGVKTGAKTGAIVGGTSGLSTGLEEDATLGSTLKNTALGTVIGGASGAVLGAIPGGVKAGTSLVNKGTKNLAKNTAKTVETKTPKLLSIFTGEDNAVIEKALKFPDQADIGIQGGDEALRLAVQKGSETSVKAKDSFIRAYTTAFKDLVKENPNKLVSKQKILYQFVDDLDKSGVKVKNGKPDFTTSLIKANPGEATKIQDAYNAIKKWNDWSLEGTNELKQLVGRLTKFATEQGGASKSPFLGKFYNFIDTEIKNGLPKEQRKLYQEMNDKFSSNIGLYDDMVDAFNSGDPFTKLAQLFSKNKDSLRQVIDFYEKTTGEQISPIVAGRQLAEDKPAAFGFLNPRQWIDFFISPKTQAKVVTKVGRLKKSNPPTKSLKGKGVIPEQLNQSKITNPSLFERAKGLTNEHRVIEDKSFNYILKNEDKILSDYFTKHGKNINVDNFRQMFPDYTAGHLSAAVQEPASYLSKRARAIAMKNEGDYVIGTAGGSGVGKTSAAKAIPTIAELHKNAAFTLDSNFSTLKSARNFINEIKASGKDFIGVYTYREFMDSVENGIIKRMLTNPEEMGRVVPNKVTASNHVNSWDVVKQLHNEGETFRFIDNSLGAGKAKLVSRAELEAKIKYPPIEQLTKDANAIVKKLYESKKPFIDENGVKHFITKQQYESLIN